MKKIITFGLLTLLAACGADSSSPTSLGSSGGSSSSGSNTTTLNAANLNPIVITTVAQDVGVGATFYHLRQNIDNASLNNVLSVGNNYNGTLVTTCVRGTVTTIDVAYSCTTSYAQTQAPFNIPDATKTVRFNLGETYTVNQVESRLQGSSVQTTVGSFTMQ